LIPKSKNSGSHLDFSIDDIYALDALGRLLSSHICPVGGLNEQDSCFVIEMRSASAPVQPTAVEIEQFLRLSGGYPTLLKAVIRWWLMQATPPPASRLVTGPVARTWHSVASARALARSVCARANRLADADRQPEGQRSACCDWGSAGTTGDLPPTSARLATGWHIVGGAGIGF